MPKLPAWTPRQIIRKLKEFGFQLDHTTGSHYIFYHPETKKRAVVPYHFKSLPKGTFLSILRNCLIIVSRSESEIISCEKY